MAQGASAFKKKAGAPVHAKKVTRTRAVIKKQTAVKPGIRYVAPRKGNLVQAAAMQRSWRADHVAASEAAAVGKLAGPSGKASLTIVRPN